MSQENEDRAKVVNALGGKKGLIDSGLPSILFLVVFNIADDLQIALYAAVATSALLTIIRLAKKDTIQHVISGFIGVAFCAYLANRTGNATDFFLPKFLTNLVYVLDVCARLGFHQESDREPNQELASQQR